MSQEQEELYEEFFEHSLLLKKLKIHEDALLLQM
jgi:hypothetical protein